MIRYFFQVGYNGSCYHGWQSQHNANSVQHEIEKALQNILQREVPIIGSSRTDTGVHCIKQFFHLDLENTWNTASILQKLNVMLPKDIALYAAKKVKPDAHARYSAIRRRYEYRITRHKNPFLQQQAYHLFRPLDIPAMNRVAASLTGEHNFQAFSKVKTQVNHFLCKLERAQWKEHSGLLVFDITANRFLRGMVRALVGSIIDVGMGKITEQTFWQIMESKDRRKVGANTPPQGLYLMDVQYPENVFIG